MDDVHRAFGGLDVLVANARTPSGALSTPEDVAAAVVFLGSAANTNICGAYLPVSGGLP